MSEFKGTKGNWVWNKGNYHDWISTQDENEIICRMGQPCLNLRVLDSNALLISKAPEMLKELSNVVSVIERLRDNPDFTDIGGHLGAMEYRCKELIKQATEL